MILSGFQSVILGINQGNEYQDKIIRLSTNRNE